MFYRRKVILSMFELLGGKVEKLQLQKLLFLASDRMEKSPYEFIPYKFGCYSFSAKADLDTMVKKGMLAESEYGYDNTAKLRYFSSLLPRDKEVIRSTIITYGGMKNDTLIKHTYLNYPFYATRSIIAKEILNSGYYQKVVDCKPNQTATTLFTIGYEGISLEKYLLKLLKNNISLLIDVRKNPLSMKYGFSKSTLKRVCNNLDIEYLHMPEVGINSDKRQALDCQTDYDKLFIDYKSTTLANTIEYQNNILQLLKEKNRVALTCFEADTCKCHRTHLAEAIEKLPEFNFKLTHI